MIKLFYKKFFLFLAGVLIQTLKLQIKGCPVLKLMNGVDCHKDVYASHIFIDESQKELILYRISSFSLGYPFHLIIIQ
ncbi:hypothetical protein [Virgibacillus sp. CBA3643]|uniref:hypothetical protein n=1 Tax=Virgibacillus sp. CBA3643 TaxID=2942278 RepID=UPI0035A300C7